MDLRDFIRESLVEIAQGISDAQFEASHLIAITPGSVGGEIKEDITEVEFDVAVTASTENTAGSEKSLTGAKLKVWSVEASAAGVLRSEKGNSSSVEKVSRIKFKVPVNLTAWFRDDEKLLPELMRKKEAFERRRKLAEEIKIPKM